MTFAQVASVGLGRMGLGIAVAHAMSGQAVTLVDFKARARPEFERRREDLTLELEAIGEELTSLGLIGPGPTELAAMVSVVDLEGAQEVLATADLIYEGVPETRTAKADALRRLAELNPRAVIASTTSTMLASELAEMVTHPERFLNAHWLNPAYISPLVEVSSHPGTDSDVVEGLCSCLRAVGKVPVRLGSSPGYIVPRLQALVMNEAARMVAEGVATPEEIDRATRFGLGSRFAALGVLEFIDFGGADILHQASEQMSESIDADRYACPPVLQDLIDAGEEGLRSGSGFFDHPRGQREDYRRTVLERMVLMVRHVRELDEPRLCPAERFAGPV